MRMNTLWLATPVMLALSAGSAVAGGSLKDGPAPTCCEANWSGLYVGAAVGYSIATHELTQSGSAIDLSGEGFQGAVTLGLDRQVSPNVVVGVFADYAFGKLEGDIGGARLNIENQWAIGARIGLVRSCCTMWYVGAGYTQADWDISGSGLSISETLRGYFVALGVEQSLHNNLSLKLEYRYSNYDDFTPTGLGTANFDVDTHAVRLGVNWKFSLHR